jgi:hypothetical protein
VVSGLPKSFDSLTPEKFDWLMSRSETPEIDDFYDGGNLWTRLSRKVLPLLKEVTAYKYFKIWDFRLSDGVQTWLRALRGRRNSVTVGIGAGPWVKASRIDLRNRLLWSFACDNLSVRPNEVVGFCEFWHSSSLP